MAAYLHSGIEAAYFDNALSKRLLKPLPDLRHDLEKYWIAPHLQTLAEDDISGG